jgi:hypothetical protein
MSLVTLLALEGIVSIDAFHAGAQGDRFGKFDE